jgi:hypothetical protein
MAGAYADVPGRRNAYDVDGSVVLFTTGITLEDTPNTPYNLLSLSDKEKINSENPTDGIASGAVYYHGAHCCFLFPEKREIDGIYAQKLTSEPEHFVNYSQDSTNGFDGTWIDTSVSMSNASTFDLYRTNITSLALSNIVALTFYDGKINVISNCGFRRIHIYGTITPGESPDRLIFLDTENSDAVFTKVLDYGDVPRGQTQTRTFKVKNNSSTKQANTVQVTAEDLYLGAGDWYSFSDDDVSYQATFPVGNLSNGGTKLLYIKQIVPDAQTPGPYAARIKANQASWT